MKKRNFGRDDSGRAVEEVTIENADAAVSILSYGCTVRDWRIDVTGRALPMVLGFPRLDGYLRHARSHGALCGRVANRIAGARFELDGRVWELTPSEGRHQLHGGKPGLGKRIWTMETDGAAGAVQLGYHSPDGEQGYPGTVDFTVTYRLDGPTLVCEMAGRPDRRTPINLANHSYYNLAGTGTVKDHVLQLDAADYTPTDAEKIPTGEIRSVDGTELDFRAPREVGDTELDVNLVLSPGRDRSKPAATLSCPRTGVRLELVTDQPGVQLFDAYAMTIGAPGHDGQSYGPYAGLCLEAQHFPDSVHHPDWPSIIRSPENPYHQRLAVHIARA